MANNKVILKKGSSASLPAIESGSLIFATDTGQTYLDVSDTERIELRDTSKVTVEQLTTQVTAAKKHSDIFDVQYLTTTSTSSPIVCTPVFSSQKDSSITADDILVDGVILFISFVSSFTSEDITVFQVGTKSFRMLGTFSCLAGDVVVARIDSVLNHSILLGVIPRNTFEAGKGLNLTGRIFTHNDFLTVGSKDTTYGGGSQVAETSQTIDLSTRSATFKIPKIKPGELGHVSEIEDYTVTFSKIDAPPSTSSNTVPVYSVTGHVVGEYEPTLISPTEYTLGDTHQLLVVEFIDGNNLSYPGFTLDGNTYYCESDSGPVPIWNDRFSALFLIPDKTLTSINYIGAFDNSPSYDGVILQYDTAVNKVNHSKQLKTGSTTVDYGGINFSTAGELTNGDTFSIPKIKVDEYGHVVSISEDESVLSVDISGNGMGIKEFVYDAAHSSSTDFVYNPLIPGTTVEVNDLLLLNFEDFRIVLPNDVLGTLDNIQCKVDTGCIANKASKLIFRVTSVSSSQISVKNIGEIAPALGTPDDSALIIYRDNFTGTSIQHKKLLTTGIPGTTYGDLVTGTDLKKTMNLPKVNVDSYGHVVNIQETSINANFRDDTLTDQTSAQYRNIVVVPSTTDLSTLDVPVGTIIFVKN